LCLVIGYKTGGFDPLKPL